MRISDWSSDVCSSDLTENGIVYPNAKLAVGGGYKLFKNGELLEVGHNLVVNEGLTDLLDVYLKAGTQTEEWYVAPWSNNVNPASTWTAANFTATAGEFTAYEETARPRPAERRVGKKCGST